MRLDDLPESRNVEDRRGKRRTRQIGGKKGGILGFIVVLIGAYYGVDLSGMVNFGETETITESRQVSAEEQQLATLSKKVLYTTEQIWGNYFKQQGFTYRNPTLVLYNEGTSTGCGYGQSAMGPFYCPADHRVYLDLSFYNDMKYQLKADGEFAFSYVIAHEIGHHIQNLLGISEQTQRAQQQARSKSEANKISVLVELQADCFAGVWGHQIQQAGRLDSGDIEAAFRAAQAVGDDRLQQQSRGRVVPDSFTHGTSAQRLMWFQRGLQSGDPRVCDTFSHY